MAPTFEATSRVNANISIHSADKFAASMFRNTYEDDDDLALSAENTSWDGSLTKLNSRFGIVHAMRSKWRLCGFGFGRMCGRDGRRAVVTMLGATVVRFDEGTKLLVRIRSDGAHGR